MQAFPLRLFFVSFRMKDPFADALGSDSDGEHDTTGTDVARSPDGKTGDTTANVVIPPPTRLSETESQKPQRDAKSESQHDLDKAPSDQGKKRKRLSAQRKTNPELRLKLTHMTASPGKEIRCVFVPRAKGEQEAIPLWPQYRAQWKSADLD